MCGKFWTIVLCCLLQACALKFQNISTLPSENKVKVVDLRPESEKETKMFSFNSLSCAFGVQRFGDEKTEPQKLHVLRQRVFEKHGEGSEVKVNHFVVYANLQASSRAPFWGPLTYTFAGYAERVREPGSKEDLYDTIKDVKCDPKESALGAYSPNEYYGQSAFVVYVDIEIKGKRSVVRHVGPPVPATINDAISKAL